MMMTSAGSIGAAGRRLAGFTETRRAPRRGRVLLVGSRCGGRARLGRALAQRGYQMVRVEDGAEALLQLRQSDFAAVILTDELPGLTGQALLPGLRVAWPEVPVIFVRRPGEAGRIAEALAHGAHACLVAPVRAPDLLRALAEVAARPAPPMREPSEVGAGIGRERSRLSPGEA